jgi:serine protease AprX
MEQMKRKAPLTDAFFLTKRRFMHRFLLNVDGKSAAAIARCLISAVLVLSCMGMPTLTERFGYVAQAHSQKPLLDQDTPAVERASKISQDLRELLATETREMSATSSPRMVDVIIQTASRPARKFLSSLRSKGGFVLASYNNVNAVAAHVPLNQIDEIAAQSQVDYVSVDRPTQAMGHLETTTGANLARAYGTLSTGVIDGSGIGIAILDSGMYANHDSISGQVVHERDFTGEGRVDDPYGHGTFVAGVAAGSNNMAWGAYNGIAPAATLLNLRVLNGLGQGRSSDTISAIDWCISNKTTYNIRVINLSLGATAVDSYVNDPLCLAVRRAVNAGIVVCVAAGNSGKDSAGNKIYGGVHSPGIEPSAITVGAANTFGTDVRSDDTVTSYSSRGPTRGYYTESNGVKHYDNLVKPDLVAPGNKIINAMWQNSYLVTTYPYLDAKVASKTSKKMMYLSGTSVASPVVAGAAALLIERNPNLTPNLVKALLEYTAQPLSGFSNFDQGAGLLNVEGAVRLAASVKSNLNNLTVGAPLLTVAAPLPTTTIALQPFTWGGGIIQKWNFLYGIELVTKYQGIYRLGVLLSDGVILSDGVLLADGTLLSVGTMLSYGSILSDGTVLADGTIFVAGTILADGSVLADGSLLADGVVMSDCVLPPATGQGALANGDAGACMTP